MKTMMLLYCILRSSSSKKCRHVVFFTGISSLFLLLLLHRYFRSIDREINQKIVGVTSSTVASNDDCLVSFGHYHGPKYFSEKFTRGTPRCLVQSKWMRLMQHSVQLSDSSSETAVITDWLWIDYHERINALVEAPSVSTVKKVHPQDRQWLIFRQHKYALDDASTLAIIGGIIEPGETPRQAASREIQEELKVTCQSMLFLGRFRTDVNRGMGYTNSFVMMDCSFIEDSSQEYRGANSEEVGESDQEQQDVIRMSTSQVQEAVRQGKFLEVQWSNTVALALIHPDVVTPYVL